MNDDSKDEIELRPEGFEGLHLDAPPNTLERFRSRASVVQGTRFVLERQFYAFWIVLNAFLKLLFKHASIPVEAPDVERSRRYRRAIQNSKDGRP